MENKIYNPAGQPKEWLIEHFVVRTKIFEKLFKEISEGRMTYPEQHFLIQGQRGMGKTTLLLRLKYEIENKPELNSWLIPVFFNEESYDLTSLSNLWEKILKYLDDLCNTGGLYYKKTDEFVGTDDYEKKCFAYLLQILNSKNKKLVIFFDNFGQLFLDNLKEREQHRLREILMNCPDIRIIGASAVVLTDLHDYSKPFYEFFKIISLEGLNKDEVFQLIEKLQEKSENKIDLDINKAKIETLAILTGGVTRTVMLVYEAILADEDGTALRDLELILDRITPLYKHRIEDLPVQQRRIVDVIAKKWDAISTKEIADNIREDGKPILTKIISAQLQQLEKNNIIEKKHTNTKNHLYQLKERFFNIWYLMRHGDRNDKRKVIWLTKFLEMWYEDENGLNSFLKEHLKNLRSGKYHTASAIMIAEAFSNSAKLNLSNFELLLRETHTIVNDEQKQDLFKISQQKFNSIVTLYDNEDYTTLIEMLSKAEISNPLFIFFLACSYYYTNNIQEAYKTISNLVPKNGHDNNLIGRFYSIVGDYSKSNEYLKLSISTPELEIETSSVIGGNYILLKKYEEAEEYFKKALITTNADSYQALIDSLLFSNKLEDAEKYCLEAIDNGLINFKKELIDIYISYFDDDVSQKKAKALIIDGLKLNENDPEYNSLNGTYEYFNNNPEESLFYLEKAHNLFLKNDIDNFHFELNLDLLLNLLVDYKKDKEASLFILKSIDSNLLKGSLLLYSSFIKIWDGKYSIGVDETINYLENELSDESGKMEIELLQDIFLLLIARKQYHSVLKIFELQNVELKNRFKPIYYALMTYLKSEFPNEIIKMGKELEHTVNDIMGRVKEMALEYNN